MCVGNGPGELREVGVLMVVVPCVVGETPCAEVASAGSETVVGIEVGRCPSGDQQRIGFIGA